MARGDKRVAVVTAAEEALRRANKPLHYQDLWAAIERHDLWDPQGTARPAETVYAYVYDDLKRHGDQSKFRFHRKGVFSLAEQGHAGPEGVQLGRKPKDKYDERERHQLEDVPRTCGNCQFIEFAGPTEATLRAGDCNSERSGRLRVQADAEACPHFRPRSLAKRHADTTRAAELAAVVTAVCFASHRGKGYDLKKSKR